MVYDYGEIWAGRPDDHEFCWLLMWILGLRVWPPLAKKSPVTISGVWQS
jgi:hypothetical protein